MDIEAIAGLLAQARMTGNRLPSFPTDGALSIEQAYAIQAATVRKMNQKIAGWKIGGSSKAGRSAIGANRPFFGRLLADRCFRSPATVSTGSEALRAVEPEIAIVLSTALPARNEPYAPEETAAAVGAFMPAFEIVDKRTPGELGDGGVGWIIADNAINDAFVFGAPVPAADLPAPEIIEVTASVNGVAVSTGAGANALGGPLSALHWLANELSRHALGLEPGQPITTGLLTRLVRTAPGDRVEGDFGPLGKIKLTFNRS